MPWAKQSLVYAPAGQLRWARSHAQVPTVDVVDQDTLRIYFSTRDDRNRSLTTYIEVRADEPREVTYEHQEPILALGAAGSFDDSGIMPAWIVTTGNEKYLYYSGWTIPDIVPYQIQIGLAVSHDGGRTFEKVSDEPVIGRLPSEPFLSSTPCVRLDDGLWRAWYLSGTKWEVIGERIEPFYHLKYAESDDGVHWRRDGVVAIDYASADEGGIVRPSVVRDGERYLMWFCHRGGTGYRDRRDATYRIGYAESADGIEWVRMDDRAGIDVSGAGWDSEMIAYPFVVDHRGRRLVFYNGNGFGQSGFGYAVWEDVAAVGGGS